MDQEKPTPGPDPERLKIEGDWEEAMRDALSKPRPDDGWPDDEDDEREEKAARD